MGSRSRVQGRFEGKRYIFSHMRYHNPELKFCDKLDLGSLFRLRAETLHEGQHRRLVSHRITRQPQRLLSPTVEFTNQSRYPDIQRHWLNSPYSPQRADLRAYWISAKMANKLDELKMSIILGERGGGVPPSFIESMKLIRKEKAGGVHSSTGNSVSAWTGMGQRIIR